GNCLRKAAAPIAPCQPKRWHVPRSPDKAAREQLRDWLDILDRAPQKPGHHRERGRDQKQRRLGRIGALNPCPPGLAGWHFQRKLEPLSYLSPRQCRRSALRRNLW